MNGSRRTGPYGQVEACFAPSPDLHWSLGELKAVPSGNLPNDFPTGSARRSAVDDDGEDGDCHSGVCHPGDVLSVHQVAAAAGSTIQQ
jgi:hypothetical protein